MLGGRADDVADLPTPTIRSPEMRIDEFRIISSEDVTRLKEMTVPPSSRIEEELLVF